MESVNEQLDLYYWIPREIPADVQEVGQRMAAPSTCASGRSTSRSSALPDGALVPLEVNMRPPGGWTVDMFNYANDFDFYREWANIVVNGRFDAIITRPVPRAVYVSRRDGRTYVLSHDDVLREFARPDRPARRAWTRVFAAAMGDHGYVLRAPELEPLLEAAAAHPGARARRSA